MRRADPLVVAALCGLSSLLSAQKDDDRPQRRVAQPFVQNAINAAIRSGMAYLDSTQASGHWTYERSRRSRWRSSSPGGVDYSAGLTALALYALAASGTKADDPVIERGLAWCKEHPDPFASGKRATYSASLLVLALSRIDASGHRKWIHKLAHRIADSQLSNGMWSYELRVRGKTAASKRQDQRRWSWLYDGDNSNTQFAVLALWTAQVAVRFRVPSRVWQKVQALYTRTQHEDGGWSYKRPRKNGTKRSSSKKERRQHAPVWMFEPSPSMTAAGVVGHTCATAALSGGLRGLAKARASKVSRRGTEALLAAKSRWPRLVDDYYFAYSLERAGTILALPDSEWYAAVAEQLVALQTESGRWTRSSAEKGATHGDGMQVYETSLALLCLSKATAHPITPKK